MQIDTVTSRQIKILRVLCIFFMMYVHINPDLVQVPRTAPALFVVNTLFANSLGRASVPALTFISGYLAFYKFADRGWVKTVRTRAQTLLGPMIFWNFVAIIIGFLVLGFFGQEPAFSRSIQSSTSFQLIWSDLLAIDNGAVQESHNFLRDLFVTAVLAIPVLLLLKKAPVLLCSAIIGIAATVGFAPLIYGPLIPVSFILGATFACKKWSITPNRENLKFPMFAALIGITAVTAVELIAASGYFNLIASFRTHFSYVWLMRLIMGSALLVVAGFLAHRHNSRLSQWLEQVERRIYFVFLGHNVALVFMWLAVLAVFGPGLHWQYQVFHILGPLVWLFASGLAYSIVSALPGFLVIAIGGKPVSKQDGLSPATKVGTCDESEPPRTTVTKAA